MSRLFGAYIIVDYSAAEGKKTGESSVWIGVMKRDVRFRLSYETHNPATRTEAISLLKTLMNDLHKRGDRIFLGLDFALGFPRGTAARLNLPQANWNGMWEFMGKNIVDKPDNTNNRFQVAAKMNRLMTDAAYPFWGCPKNAAQKWLSTLKPDSLGDFPELRLTEQATHALKKSAHSKGLWQMHGAGVVSGQSMLGIAAIRTLKAELGDKAKIWPFETGFGALDEAALDGISTVIAEVYSPLYEGAVETGEVKDATGVRLTATALAEADDKGQLAGLFAAPKALSESDSDVAATEEGWMLGI
ncbi:MAG: cobalamin biosynthesis protein CbiG [Asticcacaulis sp.]